MIKVEVTHLKAPWPAGAAVGSVVLLAAAILPAWAVGKCKPVLEGDEREPVATWEPPVLADPELIVNPASEADRKAAEAAAMLEALGQQLQDAEQALSTARAEILSLGAQLAEAKGQAEAAARAQLAAEQALQAAQQAQQGPAEPQGDAAAAAPNQATTKAAKKAAA